MVLKPGNPVVGGIQLRRQSIQSPNFVHGSAGWTINQDGSAEFTSLTVSGNSIFEGGKFVINSTGMFIYEQ